MLKKSVLVVPSSCTSFRAQPPSSNTSCRPPSLHSRRLRRHSQTRSYAQTTDNDLSSSWPDPIHPHTQPTPYQILNLQKGAPYTKHRFYQLAKLYHPDTNPPSGTHLAQVRDSVPSAVRLERYRLLMAAHALLSDPIRRSAYDRYGAGWQGHQPHITSEAYSPSRGAYDRSTPWQQGQDPMSNATWEDWERWYQRDEKTQEPVYLSNAGFVSIVIICAMLVNVGQATRAGNFGSSIMEQRDTLHAEASRELIKARQTALNTANREERIRNFLRQRDAGLYVDADFNNNNKNHR